VTLLLFVASIAAACIGIGGSLSGGMSALALGWALAAGGFGILMAIRAGISFVYNDGDYVEMWSVLSAFMYTVFALFGFNWFGIIAAVLVTAGWLTGTSGRREDERLRRVEMQHRREALKAHGRRGSSGDAVEGLLEESSLDLTDRTKRRVAEDAYEDLPVTRRGTVERARMIDGNPWSLPPDQK
jgi:hypothetical protein